MSEVGRYRKLYPRIWRQPGFAALTEGEKVLALYLLTSPQSNRIGLHTFSFASAAEDLDSTTETLKKRFANVSVTFGWSYDSTARVLYVPSWWRWNPPENANVLKGNLRDLKELPPCGVVDAFCANFAYLPETFHETFLEGVRKHSPQPSRTQEQELELRTGPKQKRDQSALRAVADYGRAGSPNAQVVALAQKVTTESKGEDTDYLIDALKFYGKEEGLQISRSEAVLALGLAGNSALPN